MAKKESKIEIYCKCENCGVYFEFKKKARYCSSSCIKKAYYRRKHPKKDKTYNWISSNTIYNLTKSV